MDGGPAAHDGGRASPLLDSAEARVQRRGGGAGRGAGVRCGADQDPMTTSGEMRQEVCRAASAAKDRNHGRRMPHLIVSLSLVLLATNALPDECRRGFEVADPIITSFSPDSAVYGDFDEDGLIDVAYTTSTDRLRHVALNRGNGLFMPLPASAAIFDGSSLVLAASADMNRDGHLDLLYYTVNGVLGVSFGDGHGAFAPVILSFAAATTQRWVFDVNHDGIPDFIEALTAGGVRVA